ncbi:MAG: reverse transcriptase domain-containing protein, partial [Cyanobacteriota bacterium]
MAKEDVELLKQYYAHSYFQVAQGSGEVTAKIRLQRGLRQGCPLSPILGGVVVNALIRWLESKGGGYQHSSGEEYNTLLFADDSTLLTESKEAMQTLLDTVESFSDWSGIRVNLRKSEISGYNFRSRRALWVRDLT